MSEHDEAVHYAREVAKVEGKTPGRVWAERLIQEERERILDMPMLFVADIDALLVHTKSLALHYNKYAATDTEVRERLSFIVALATDLLESLYPGESEQ